MGGSEFLGFQEQEHVLHFTMKEFLEDPEVVIDNVNSEDRPALITKHGTFIAIIQPASKVVEGEILAKAIELGLIELNDDASNARPVDELLAELDREEEIA